MRKLTKGQKRDAAVIAAKKDPDIDFSDMPPIVDWSGAEVGKFYRPEKRPVTMRLDVDVIEWLRADGPGYQTKANLLLRHAMLHFSQKKLSARRENTRARSKRQMERGEA
ncbi:MAG: BrnA antitoxin family protein [Candidatus Acidiferrum sp.]